jgi:cytochrome c553
MQTPNNKKKIWILNIIFLIACAAILIFLFKAPKETTSTLPHDDIHAEFFLIKSKKEAEKNCLSCHGSTGDAPLKEGHPSKFRCLLCHKRI